MYIECTNAATRRLFNEVYMDEPVEFASTGTAQVSADIGEALVANYDDIRPYEAED